MKNNRKALLLLLCAVLMVSASVFGTLAYLTDTDDVTNTFSVGQVGLKLDEAKVNTEGKPVDKDGNVLDEVKDAPRVDGNEYHLLPGHTYVKDPTVTVDAKSADSYVRMVVDVKNIGELKAALPTSESINNDDGTTTIVTYPDNAIYYADLDKDGEVDDFALEKLLDNSWNYNYWEFVKYSESGTTGTYEFRYRNHDTKVNYVVYSESETKLPALFTKIKVPGEIDNTHLAHLDNVEIVVTAHAMQRDGFETAEDSAWGSFDNQMTPTTPNP